MLRTVRTRQHLIENLAATSVSLQTQSVAYFSSAKARDYLQRGSVDLNKSVKYDIPYSNRSKIAQWTVQEEVFPSSLQEIVEIIQRGARENKHIKAIGNRHTINSSASTDGIQVRLDKLNKVLHIDKTKKTITAEGGILLRDLFLAMHQNGLALPPSMPNINDITLAGAVANCTHGTNIEWGTFSDLVEEITLVTGNEQQQVLTINRHDESMRSYYEAVVASFGTLGIFYSITMRCIDDYHMFLTVDGCKYSEKQDLLDKIATSYPSAQMAILPQTDSLIIRTQTPISPIAMRPTKDEEKIIQRYLRVHGFMKAGYIYGKIGRIIAWIAKKVVQWDQARDTDFQTIHQAMVRSWYNGEVVQFGNTIVVNMEYVVPIERINEVVKDLLKLMAKYRESGKYNRFVPLHIRPVGKDKYGYLSLTKGRDSCCIDMPYQTVDENEIEFYKEAEELYLRHDARVSWARLFWCGHEKIKRQYPEIDKFLEVKKQLDPNNIFSNEFTDRVLGLGKYSEKK